jgi:glycosyltransferase involved in cell wall biosynthesis
VKILIPISYFSASGGARVLSKLATHWIEAGHEVTFLVAKTGSAPHFPTKASLIYANTHLADSADIENVSLLRKATRYLNLYRKLLQTRDQYDIVLATHSLTTWPIFFARWKRIKCFYYIQAFEPNYFLLSPSPINFLLAIFSALSYFLPFHQIANAPRYKERLFIRAKDWVPPGIDFNLFFPEENKTRGEEIILGTIGRPEPSKGTIYVLNAFQKLRLKFPRVKLRSAFGGIPEHFDKTNVEEVYPRNDKELGEFYRSLDILIAVPISQFGSPHYPVMESMACGIPVISTGHLPANSENATLVPPRDADAIYNALLNFIESPGSFIEKKEAAQRAIQEFNWPCIGDKFLRIFNKFLRNSDN